ncbi:hypothetical protein KZX45_09660 [Georgenia sp. EYE_87]|uniref:hypothetical protein n=1 Tax=Georgenia sp. EYE_87 TaxID=2853448 RepID=UPI00200607C1|nr:hypothetical protein [Georgenia sp. EYE_87]MCK6210807.1 hypothetical protein [Georgenia sp. EYE_87]
MIIAVAAVRAFGRRAFATSAALLLCALATVALSVPSSAVVVQGGEAGSVAGAEASVVTTGLTTGPTEARLVVGSPASVGSGAAAIVGGAVLLAAGAYTVGRWQQDQRLAAQSVTWGPSFTDRA